MILSDLFCIFFISKYFSESRTVIEDHTQTYTQTYTRMVQWYVLHKEYSLVDVFYKLSVTVLGQTGGRFARDILLVSLRKSCT